MPFLINIVLVALTAAGPWVCCYTTAAISRATSKLSQVVSANKRQSDRTCCHPAPPRKPVGARAANKPSSMATTAKQTGRHAPGPQDRSCPCYDRRQELVAANVSDDSRLTPGSRDFISPTGLFLGATLAPHSLVGSACAAASRGSLLPFMSTGERLCAHHALRC